jgi:hypothetical protein
LNPSQRCLIWIKKIVDAIGNRIVKKARNHKNLFDPFGGAKPRFLNRGKKRRSELALSLVEWVDSHGGYFTQESSLR